MREKFRLLIAGCCYYSGLVKFTLWLKQRQGRRLIILNYHQAISGNLKAQLRYLRRHYRIMPLEDALGELYAPAHLQGDRRMLLAVTFDDGYLDNYTHAFPLIRQLRIPITIFLIPGLIERGSCFWWLAGSYLAQHTLLEQVMVDGRTYQLAQATEREALAQAIDVRVRYAQSVGERETLLTRLQSELGVDLPRRADEMGDLTLPLNWGEIAEMERSGWISFGAHTMHHPVLACLADVAEVRYEIEECRRTLELRLSQPVRTFAYPIGKPQHIGKQALEAVKMAGYRWALTTIEAVNTPHTEPHLLARLPGDVKQHWLIMAAELAGLLGLLSRLKQW